jgi:hypothetical protein
MRVLVCGGRDYGDRDNLYARLDTNWRGVRTERRIRPTGELAFENNEWHPVTQWLLYAEDMASGEIRTFALSGIHSCKPAIAAR